MCDDIITLMDISKGIVGRGRRKYEKINELVPLVRGEALLGEIFLRKCSSLETLREKTF